MKDDNEDTLDVLGNIYKYDQLQRIKSMDVYSVATQSRFCHLTPFQRENNPNTAHPYL